MDIHVFADWSVHLVPPASSISDVEACDLNPELFCFGKRRMAYPIVDTILPCYR